MTERGRFEVHYVEAAREDLERLQDLLLEQAETADDLDDAVSAMAALEDAIEWRLSRSPFIFRKVGAGAFRREVLIPFKRSGYVALFEIESDTSVRVLAIRHQLEDDYH